MGVLVSSVLYVTLIADVEREMSKMEIMLYAVMTKAPGGKWRDAGLRWQLTRKEASALRSEFHKMVAPDVEIRIHGERIVW